MPDRCTRRGDDLCADGVLLRAVRPSRVAPDESGLHEAGQVRGLDATV